MTLLVLYAIVCTALWHLGSAATITYSLRKHFPSWLNELLSCPACSGTWYGLGCGIYGYTRDWRFLDLGSIEGTLAAGAFGLVVTPLLGALHLRCLSFCQEILHGEVQER